jgi:hypothetical protein
MFGSPLPPVVCLIYVILLCVFTFRVLCCDVRFVFTSSCLFYLGSPIMCLYVLSSVLWCPLRFPHKNDVRFVFTSSAVVCLIYVICVCLRIVVSNTYCVAFLFCFSSSCVLYVASFSGLSMFDCHFFNAYLEGAIPLNNSPWYSMLNKIYLSFHTGFTW